MEQNLRRCETLYTKAEKKGEVISELEVDIQANEVSFSHEYFRKDPVTKMEFEYDNIQEKLKMLTKKASIKATNNIELPKIKIPTFRSGYDNWAPFHDLFEKLIHSNEKLSNAEKMHYLKGHVDGEAARLIQHLMISEQNYVTAWKILQNRYNNKRLMVNTLLDRILEFSKMETAKASRLKWLHDTIHECLETISNLGMDTSSWGPMVIRITTKKWDSETNRLFEQSLKQPNEIPALGEVMQFMQTRFQSLEASGSMQSKDASPRYTWGNTSTISCHYCQQEHRLEQCLKFKGLSINDRNKEVRERKICFRCLKHNSEEKCYSAYRCAECGYPHHTLLHQPYKPIAERATQASTRTSHTTVSKRNCQTQKENQEVLLATAIVQAQDLTGVQQLLRVLVDPGSQASFITEKAAQQLKLPRQKANARVSGIGGYDHTNAKTKITVQLHPRQPSEYELTTELIILTKITENLPLASFEMNKDPWKNVLLADPTLNNSGPIDILLGAEEYAKIILPGVMKEGKLVGQQTEFGWVISGQTKHGVNQGYQILGMVSTMEEETQLSKYWEIEEATMANGFNEEDKKCEDHYKANTTRSPDGRYTVKIPFKKNSIKWGRSRPLAIARLLQLEKKLAANDKMREEYNAFLQEYLDLGHMEMVQAHSIEGTRYYIPHQPVIKESSTTTKMRVVFDASAKTTTSGSLNEMMYVGPRLQPDIADILLRWRKHQYAFTADIKKMYRQIRIHQDDRQFQTIVWRFERNQPIREYQLNTVTYGTAAAPYLAIKTLQQLAEDEKEEYPYAARVTLQDFYVDDILSGANSIPQVVQLQKELTNMLKKGGFQLHKWAANKEEILTTIPMEARDPAVAEFNNDDQIKSLGIRWIPNQDIFTFKFKDGQDKPTKRNILSEVAKIFDPLGWLSPILLNAKLLIQRLWLSNTGWDEEVAESIKIEWTNFKIDLSMVEYLRIPRWMQYDQDQEKIELHGFCDASEKAYGAVVYSKTGNGCISLLMSKSKVAPVRTRQTLPKLELCAAVLLAKVLKRVTEALQIPKTTVYAWTDSMITLAWMKGDANKWKTFVGSRVAQITSMTAKEQWNHVRTNDNPADLVSRGTTTSKLKNNTLWWNGPIWLKTDKWKHSTSEYPTTEVESKKTMTIIVNNRNELAERFSSLTQLIRVTAYIIRFIKHCKKITVADEHLTVEELNTALKKHIQVTQQNTYPREIQKLSKKEQVHKDSKLESLNPFQDEDSLLRADGKASKRSIHQLIPITTEEGNTAEKNQTATSQQHAYGCNLKTFVISILMLLVTVTAEYNITYPKPGFYIEHMGEVQIERGIFRIDLQYNKSRIKEDINAAFLTTSNFKELCKNATEMTENVQCTELVQHIEDQENQLRWVQEGINYISQTRKKRGILGNILTAIFGVNDEVYKDIDALNKNQQELMRNSERQSKIMLSTISKFKETENRIEKQLERFNTKLNEAIKAINQMQKWYKTIDENRLNIHILSTYQTSSESSNRSTQSLQQNKKHPLQPRELSRTYIRNPHQKYYYIGRAEITKHPQDFTTSNNQKITVYVIMKVTPIPIKIENSTFWTLNVNEEMLAVDYNNQLYFEISNEEFKDCLQTNKHNFICAPTMVKKIEENKNCIIDEVYNRTEINQCNIQQHEIQGLIWKQLYATNTWMFITNQSTRIAISCSGERQEITINATGIIRMSQDCLLKTKKSILNPKRDKKLSVLGSYIKQFNKPYNHTRSTQQITKVIEESIFHAEDSFKQLKDEEETLNADIRNIKWRSTTSQSIITSTTTTLLIAIILALVLGIRFYIQHRNKSHTKDNDREAVQLEPLYSTIPGETQN
ncbi:uncharacterized protein LOC116170471 [Photinus pyralis]|uniref:uncharacterized protein LOC116170471 n=1 Tax=Photinus pyralis TaxID=7054 RepID=UPI001266F70E|nr:uncharacterized protein LOC116170471 [Photinus pyralis]